MDSIYQKRCDALYERIDNFLSVISNATTTDPVRQYALEQLGQTAIRLKLFAQGYFTYFDTTPEPPGHKKEYAIALGIFQVGNDLEVLEQAAQQRLSNGTGYDRAWKALNQADQMARRILQAAHGLAGFGPESTALVYFQKSPRFHGTPYAPLALTAIPYSAVYQHRDLLATPHELGHYVYQRFKNNNRLKGLAVLAEYSWVGNWTEEIFADVFGYLVGGPIVSEGLQELLLRHLYTSFATADFHDTHPTPIMRPYIFNLTLNSNSTKPSDAAKQVLMNHWRGKWTGKMGRAIPEYTRADGQGDAPVPEVRTPLGLPRLVNELISIASDRPQPGKPVDNVVEQILTQLAGLKQIDGTPSADTWATSVANGQTEEAIEGVFIDNTNKRKDFNSDHMPQIPTINPWPVWLAAHEAKGWLGLVHAEDWIEKPPDNWPKIR